MNTESLFLFLILLLGLVLCSFLGGNCGSEGFTGKFSGTFNVKPVSGSGSSTSSSNQYDNYNHYTGNSTKLITGSTYYGPQGTTANVTTNGDGLQSLQIILPGSSTPVTFMNEKYTSDVVTDTVESYTNYYGRYGRATKFYGPNGATATVITTNNGQTAIKVTTPDGTYYYNISGTHNNYFDDSTQYYGSTGYTVKTYDGSYGGNAVSATGPYGGNVTAATGPAGNTFAATNYNNDYSSALPPGIPRSQIPQGQEDLYILKSEVVPPVCPACPSSSVIPRQEPCPACPPCGRCPEPSFECKKVPNYSSINNDYLPAPVLNDFSQFGM